MDEWSRHVRGKIYITDLGKNDMMDLFTGPEAIGRYLVWVPCPDEDRHIIADEGNDLEVLMKKYNVPLHRVERFGAFFL